MDIKKIIAEIYEVSPYEKEYVNKTNFDNEKVGSAIYGEVTQKGTNSIIKYFKEYFNKDTVFYDLGSGLSKMVIHIGMEYEVKKSVGIEFSKERHKGAKEIQEKFAKEYKNIEIIEGNVLHEDYSDATVIYMDNTVFPKVVNHAIYNKIPTGCLVLLKKPFGIDKIATEKIHTHNSLVDRTYAQKKISWFIKE